MGRLVEVAKTGDLEVGAMKKICVEGRELLLARTVSSFYCSDVRCPHLNGDLSQGTLTGTIVTCPDHYSQFDLASGAVVRWTNLAGVVARLDLRAHPPKPLAVYEVKVEGDRVLVRLP
jgi:3-phenylpropionate/trans-cinnamate dioxygenase ferredoxin component